MEETRLPCRIKVVRQRKWFWNGRRPERWWHWIFLPQLERRVVGTRYFLEFDDTGERVELLGQGRDAIEIQMASLKKRPNAELTTERKGEDR